MAQNLLNFPHIDKEIVIPIICENSGCQSHGRCINTISGIPLVDLDLFYDNYDGGDLADYCPACGKLGVAEDPVVA